MRDARSVLLGLLVLTLCLSGAGCGPMPGEKETVDVTAQYHGLDNQRVAVMVSADPYLVHSYPDAPRHVCQAVTSRIAKNVPGVTTTIPDEIIVFQEKNPYWMNMRYGELVTKLGVDKVVLIDLIEYQTHEPGNAHVWQGLVTANVGVIDRGAVDPDNFVFHNTVDAVFPEKSSIGVIDSDDETIQIGLLYMFSQRCGGMFYDHKAEVER